jgi:AraC family transcriptional regulator
MISESAYSELKVIVPEVAAMTLRRAEIALQRVCISRLPCHGQFAQIDRKSPASAQQSSGNAGEQRAPVHGTWPRHPDRVTAIMDGQVKVLGTEPPEFSSAATGWSGFLLERHSMVDALEKVRWHSSHVIMCLGGSAIVRVSGGAGNASCVIRPGRIFIFPRGCDHTNIALSGGHFRFAVTELDRTRLGRLFPGAASSSEESLVPQLNIADAHIVAKIGNMLAEAAAGCPCGPLYGECLSLTLAAYVAARYSMKNAGSERSEHGFTSTQAQMVIEYVHAHLRRDLSLLELAAAIDLSPRHFSRLFRTTFGTSPHRYVIAERVNEAKALLANKRLSVSEIAEALGFVDQSHLTNVFRKATGVSPKRYQREC